MPLLSVLLLLGWFFSTSRLHKGGEIEKREKPQAWRYREIETPPWR